MSDDGKGDRLLIGKQHVEVNLAHFLGQFGTAGLVELVLGVIGIE